MSEWVDGDSSDQRRASIYLEDASSLVRAAGWLVERLDPGRVAMLAHRRMLTSPDGPLAGLARHRRFVPNCASRPLPAGQRHPAG